MVDIKQYRKKDLENLVERFKKSGFIALMEANYVCRDTDPNAVEKSTSQILTLSQALIDCIEFAAEHASDD